MCYIENENTLHKYMHTDDRTGSIYKSSVHVTNIIICIWINVYHLMKYSKCENCE